MSSPLLSRNLNRFRKSREKLETIHAQAVADSNFDFSFAALLILASSIATLGLASNSEATIIGAMLVSPMVRPVMSLAYGVAQADLRLSVMASLKLAAGILLSLLTSILVENLLSLYEPTDQIMSKIRPNMIDMAVAIAAAVVGTLGLTRSDISRALPGVAVAVSLVPPLCVTGIGLSVGSSLISWGSFALFLVNLLAIVLVASLVFLAEGMGRIRRALAPIGLVLAVVAGFAYWLQASEANLRHQDKAHEIVRQYLRDTYLTEQIAHPVDLARVLVLDYPGYLFVAVEIKGHPTRFSDMHLKQLHQQLTAGLNLPVNLKVLHVHAVELRLYPQPVPGGEYGLDLLVPKR